MLHWHLASHNLLPIRYCLLLGQRTLCQEVVPLQKEFSPSSVSTVAPPAYMA
jgi:hypothetical protein